MITLHRTVTNALSVCGRQLKEDYFRQSRLNTQLATQVSSRSSNHITVLQKIEAIVNDAVLSNENKVRQIQSLYHQMQVNSDQLQEDRKRLQVLTEIQQARQDNEDYYLVLEKQSIKLQNRVSAIVEHLVFDETTSGKDIVKAVNHFQIRQGLIAHTTELPISFLPMEQRQQVFHRNGKLRPSLYKVLLFCQIRDHIRAGTLNVASSYNYRSFGDFLIARSLWLKQKDALLLKVGIASYASASHSLLTLNERLNRQFAITNGNLPTNSHVRFDATGQWHLSRSKKEESQPEDSPQQLTRLLYPQDRVLSILEILTQVNHHTNFLNAFEHRSPLYQPKRPDNRLFLAAIIGYGENIGISKMTLISKNIGQSALETVSTHYFSPEMTLKANDLVVSQCNRLPLTDLFRKQTEFIHTGSDGMKVDVSVPCLRASASFKYFGNGKGVTVYSHLDRTGQLYYSTVFSVDEDEAHYMLDGLTYNEVIKPDAHSTDDHGHSLPVFAVTGLIEVECRPRIANLSTRQLFSLDAVHTYKELGYRIHPDEKVDYENLVMHWDEILRLVCTIKLGYAKASDLFRRLNSYDRQNPLYKALCDLGKLYRTLYILRYLDDQEMRQSVEGVLAAVEHNQKFARAVGGDHAYPWATQREQLIAEGCKRLLMNAINYYNMLLLSEGLSQCRTELEREEWLNLILKTTTHTWHHINLHGIFDFLEKEPESSFDLEKIMNLLLTHRRGRAGGLG